MTATATSLPPASPPRQFDEHEVRFMEMAFDLAEEALIAQEVPIGCVFVADNQRVIARARNRTNEKRNGTRHAELEAIDYLYEKYGQSEFHQLMARTDVYVTVEPCIMCASALMEVGVRKVYFGCFNEKFGGCGSVLDLPALVRAADNATAPRPLCCEGGLGRDRAVLLLRQFYIQENTLAPEPRRKTGRKLKLDDLNLDGMVKRPALAPKVLQAAAAAKQAAT